MIIFNLRLIQLAVISICLIASTQGIQQSGCANLFQLAPLPFCDGTSQIPGVSSGGGGFPPVSSGGGFQLNSKSTASQGSYEPGGSGSKKSLYSRYRRSVVEMPKPAKSLTNSFVDKVGNGLIFKTNQPSKAVAGGEGVCGNYDTNTVMGVCLWSGIDTTGKDPSKSGWISGSATTNCNREVEIWRSQSPDKKFTAKVVDGCGLENTQFKIGCENVFVTKKLLAALDPTAEEEIQDLKWNFKKIQTIF